MYGIRHKETKEYLKLFKSSGVHYLAFAPAIEINYYVNQSLGFVESILFRETQGRIYAPNLSERINQHDLEVVNLKTLEVVSKEELFDGREETELPPYVEPEEIPITIKRR